MKKLFIVFVLLTAAMFVHQAKAQQLELPFKASDEILLEAYPGDANTILVTDLNSLPIKVRAALADVDLPLEMGDGYYDFVTGATYAVIDDAGIVVGYLEAELLSYSQDPEYHLGLAFITIKGRRLGKEPNQDSFNRGDHEDLARLPIELRPGDDE